MTEVLSGSGCDAGTPFFYDFALAPPSTFHWATGLGTIKSEVRSYMITHLMDLASGPSAQITGQSRSERFPWWERMCRTRSVLWFYTLNKYVDDEAS